MPSKNIVMGKCRFYSFSGGNVGEGTVFGGNDAVANTHRRGNVQLVSNWTAWDLLHSFGQIRDLLYSDTSLYNVSESDPYRVGKRVFSWSDPNETGTMFDSKHRTLNGHAEIVLNTKRIKICEQMKCSSNLHVLLVKNTDISSSPV